MDSVSGDGGYQLWDEATAGKGSKRGVYGDPGRRRGLASLAAGENPDAAVERIVTRGLTRGV